MRDTDATHAAIAAKEYLQKRLGTRNPAVGIVLGTGWGGALSWDSVQYVPFEEIPGFDRLRPLPGHDRKVAYGTIGGREVLALQGRIHMNEAPSDPRLAGMVRLQTEMLLQLGVKTLIITSAAGSLKKDVEVGDIVLVDGFITLFAPEMPLYTGEFISPEDTLDPRLRVIAAEAITSVHGRVKEGAFAMIRGPFFEGRKYDKGILAGVGASAVAMSMLPEACVAALYPETRVLAMSFITNDASEDHSHETNQARAKDRSATLGVCLRGILDRL
jgi:purine-nucleoside phosphorylase